MPGQTAERAFETCVEQILLTRGGWKSASNAAMERLQEDRTALITAAVTGRIDVRKESHGQERSDSEALPAIEGS